MKSADKIFFRNLKISANIGLLPHEKSQPQRLLLDLEFVIDASAVKTLADTVDYSKVREVIVALVTARHYDLLETLAHSLSQHLLSRFGLPWLRLSLKKPDIFPDMDAVGVVIERGQ